MEEATAKTQEINQAYQVIKDRKNRLLKSTFSNND